MCKELAWPEGGGVAGVTKIRVYFFVFFLDMERKTLLHIHIPGVAQDLSLDTLLLYCCMSEHSYLVLSGEEAAAMGRFFLSFSKASLWCAFFEFGHGQRTCFLGEGSRPMKRVVASSWYFWRAFIALF